MAQHECVCGCGEPANPSRHGGMPVASWNCYFRAAARGKVPLLGGGKR